MAPLLRQAIQLLQLSPLELQEMGRNERLGDPLLEAAVPHAVATTLETTPPMPMQPALGTTDLVPDSPLRNSVMAASRVAGSAPSMSRKRYGDK
jgi:DNA-directed RNA polymerase specialized sigma54-like protein